MQARFKSPRGTADVLPGDQPYWDFVIRAAGRLSQLFGYSRIETPIFEEAALFNRSVGESSELVEKQTYQFRDRGDDLIALRPEGTAGVCRAYLQSGMHNLSQPVRLWYVGPYFRYDRPQAGRMRQFNQFGLEAIGEASAVVDAEVAELSWLFYEELGLNNLTMEINSIGDSRCRPSYLKELRDYYQENLINICDDCRWRFEHNLLRMLDCKELVCQSTIAGAPPITDYICDDCDEHFRSLQSYLDMVMVPYVVNPRLVRGLDYYTRTVFEILPHEEGAQATIGAGGRYDDLIEELGGRPTPGIGFATGIDRTIINLKRQKIAVNDLPLPQAFIAFQTEEAALAAYRLASNLRRSNHPVAIATGGRSLKAQMRQANASGAPFALIIGRQELSNSTVVIRRLDDGQQETIPLAEVSRYFDNVGN